jgi:hypothetical protein
LFLPLSYLFLSFFSSRWLRVVETVGRQYAFIKFGESCSKI